MESIISPFFGILVGMLVAIIEIKKEHQEIRQVLKIFTGMINQFESGKEVVPQHLQDLLEYFEFFINGIHHKKEEEIFYPALENSADLSERELLEVDLGEHDLSKRLTKGFHEGVQRFLSGDKTNFAQLVEYSQDLIKLTTEHADREDKIVLPLVEKCIPLKLQEQLSTKYLEEEKQRVGIGRGGQFLLLLPSLEKIYL